MDTDTLIIALDFARTRLLTTLDTIEKSGQDAAKVLAWRPGPGRAHIGWQAMHCAATHDRYLNVGVKGRRAARRGDRCRVRGRQHAERRKRAPFGGHPLGAPGPLPRPTRIRCRDRPRRVAAQAAQWPN